MTSKFAHSKLSCIHTPMCYCLWWPLGPWWCWKVCAQITHRVDAHDEEEWSHWYLVHCVLSVSTRNQHRYNEGHASKSNVFTQSCVQAPGVGEILQASSPKRHNCLAFHSFVMCHTSISYTVCSINSRQTTGFPIQGGMREQISCSMEQTCSGLESHTIIPPPHRWHTQSTCPTTFSIACGTVSVPCTLVGLLARRYYLFLSSFAIADGFGFTIWAGQHIKIADGHWMTFIPGVCTG